MHAVDPVKLSLADGREVTLYLSMAGLKAVKERLSCKTVAELLERDVVDCLPIFWEAVEDKTDLDEATFAQLLPANLPLMQQKLLALLGSNLPPAQGPPAAASPNP